MTPSGTFIINGAERVIVSQKLFARPAYIMLSDYDKLGQNSCLRLRLYQTAARGLSMRLTANDFIM